MLRRTLPRPNLYQLALAIAVVAPVLLGAKGATTDDAERVVVSFIGEANSPAARGAALGIEEANRAARYFGFQLELDPRGTPGPLGIAASSDGAALEALVGPGRVVINSRVSKRSGCRAGLFHVAPSDAMVASARAQWREALKSEAPSVAAWHPSLVKFAARDLNKRYLAQYGEVMRSEAWAAWAAARSFGEAVLRTRSVDPAQIATYFRGAFGLDGQKGRALTFRPNRQLRQPLYYVDADDEVVGEAPLADAVPDLDLDSLGNIECAP